MARDSLPDLSTAHWHKSSYSNGDGGSCVEVDTSAATGAVPVRDTKTAPTGTVLTFPAHQWTHFVSALRQRSPRG
ncbi:DUF397 domain-containing protein [Streptomyces tubbatahanensis]|uniref:DUF397 domain-containing protein n=1 Tax=Streptomyces tubbatahanensis TaxID=2923272 RepID=A0ABY3XYX5_9ACTN|nr:DUF397 domain-containing protein [Streptomyces tubbatahanensis]UNS99590.1 DUF397 domain-containing protein [Streptomyces tubbatahanensis]